MAAAALLPSPRAAGSDAATAGAPSVTLTSPTSPSRTKNVRLAAAADLIRNLDAALSGMTTAAASAADDAARARRNAKAAGEVARRYGGSSALGGKGRKKKVGAIDHEGLLERKRELRAAARMAAEARQRREHPPLASPRRTPRSTRGGIGVFWGAGSPRTPVVPAAAETTNATAEEEAVKDRAAAIATRPAREPDVPPPRPPQVEMKIETGPENSDANVGSEGGAVQKLFYESTPLGNTEVVSDRTPVIADSTPLGTTEVLSGPSEVIDDSIPPVITEGSNVSNLNDFEDAVEHHNYQGGPPFAADSATQQPPSKLQATEQPANTYYMQQNQYYDHHQQQYHHHQQQQQPYYQSNQGQNAEYYNQSQQQYYDTQPQQQPYSGPSVDQRPPTQQQPAATAAAEQPDVPQPSPKHPVPATPPRAQPASTNRIEASHAEDVLSLSLELERVRAQLASATSQLSDATSQVGYLTSQNHSLESRLSDLHSEFESANERSSTQLATAQEQLEGERIRSKAAEEDAALALELAKEAQISKEECEMWLSKSLEEIDLWRGRVGGLEHQLKEQKESHERKLREKEEEATRAAEAEGGPKKARLSVRFKEDCPPSPVVSEDGGLEDGGLEVAAPMPPPLAPPAWSSPAVVKSDAGSHDAAATDATSPIVANDGIRGINSGVFSPTGNSTGTPTSDSTDAGTPSKSDMIASGRVYLQRASPSPLKNGLSPHPREQAMSLLKKSAETRRLLRERLTPGSNGGAPHKPPVKSARMPRPSSDNALSEKGDSFASRQGAACRAIGRTVRESGARLKLDGAFMLTNGGDNSNNPDSEPVIEGVAQLESMVRGYCGSVEGTIGRQREKIDELLAFCDHLEKEVMAEREE